MTSESSSDTANSNYITVVSGLPRSGTSMMMQMLVAGGIPALTDGQREADQDNLKGYLEFEVVKNLRQDQSWIPQAKGHVVKVIAQLVEHLPPEEYRYIFMQRDIDEVINSQRTMLERSDKPGAKIPEKQLKDIFAKQLLRAEKLVEGSSAPILKVNHRDCIEDPTTIAAEVNRFLGGGFDELKMAAVVDPKLHRQKS